MVASNRQYHILGKRIAAERLHIGSVIDSIDDLVPLNVGQELKLKDIQNRLYCHHEINFKGSRDESLKGEAGLALNALSIQGVGGETKVNEERGNTDTYKFEELDTIEFEAAKEDYLVAVKANGVQAFLTASGYCPVYMITGLKIGRESSIDYKKVRQMGGGLEFGVNIGSAVSIGPKINASKTVTTTQKSEGVKDELIFAIRVRKLKYKKKYGLFGAKSLVDEAHNIGAEMVGVNKSERKEEEPEFDVEEVELEEEEDGFAKIGESKEDGEVVTWVIAKDW